MRILKQFAAVVLALELLLLTGCSGGGNGNTPTSSQGGSILTSAVIGPGGGTLTLTKPTSPLNGTQVVIPAGALSSPTTITLGTPTGPTGLAADVLVVELGPTGTVFSVPVSVTVKYSSQYLTNNGIVDESTLKVVSMDTGIANQTLSTISQDTSENTITAQSTHFSNFAILGYTNATLSGSYAVAFYDSDAPVNLPPVRGFHSELGTLTFDGVGNFTWSGTKNTDGVSTAVAASGTYAVAVNGTLTLNAGGTNKIGNVLAGGSTFILASTSGQPVQIGIGVKTGGTFSTASLDGSYAVAFYDSDAPVNLPPVRGFHSELGTLTFDGVGNFTWSGTKNTDGVSTAVAASGTYAVAVNGTLTLNAGGTNKIGNVLAGGSTFILASTSGQPVQIGIGVKTGGTFSTASLNGSYAVAFYDSDAPVNLPPVRGFHSELGTLTFDGVGNFTWSGTKNTDGVSTAVAASGTYAVAVNGTLTLSGTNKIGNVLAGGSTFILASTSGQPVQIAAGILK